MPNWITNTVEIRGDNQEIGVILAILNSEDCVIDFTQVGENFENVRLDPDPANTFIVQRTDNLVEFEVETAWQSPDEPILQLSREFPNCTFEMWSHDGNQGWHSIFKDGLTTEIEGENEQS